MWLERGIVAALVAGLLLSTKLWVSTRTYPLVPLLSFVSPLAYPLDYLVLGLFGVLLTGIVFFRGRSSGVLVFAALALAALLALQDQGRLQPWFYQYCFMLAAVGLFELGRLSTEGAMNACRLIVAFTYVWSGLQKANLSFVRDVYPWLVEPLASLMPAGTASTLEYGAYAVPVVETAIGIGLLVRPLRGPAVVGAASMHAFIFFTLGPWGHDWNSVIWPWNLAMVVFVSILFWRAPDAPPLLAVIGPGGSAFRGAVLILFAVMPALNFFGLWDSYLSANLYSGSLKEGYVYAAESSSRTRISDTAIAHTNTPAYPEERVYKRVFVSMWCEEAPPSREPVLVVYGRPGILSGRTSATTYRCDDVWERRPETG